LSEKGCSCQRLLEAVGMTAETGWLAALQLRYAHVEGRSVSAHAHEGPLRVLKSLYPEGDTVCHDVIVHPPGGVVAGDRLRVNVDVGSGAHALVTTPGATRFYRSDGAVAEQAVNLHLQPMSRLEWVPLEAVAYPGARVRNSVRVTLGEGAELIGWDMLCLGLPASNQPFDQGWWQGHIEIGRAWLEQATLHAQDQRLLRSPLGLAGHVVVASAWWTVGPDPGQANAQTRSTQVRERVNMAVDAARMTLAADEAVLAGLVKAAVTEPAHGVVVLRVLAHRSEPAGLLLRQVRMAWRTQLWQMDAVEPRVWST
jgi:urease accessory protein